MITVKYPVPYIVYVYVCVGVLTEYKLCYPPDVVSNIHIALDYVENNKIIIHCLCTHSVSCSVVSGYDLRVLLALRIGQHEQQHYLSKHILL